MKLLGIDIGTTNCKAALFDINGAMVKLTMRPTVAFDYNDERGAYYCPNQIWNSICDMLQELTSNLEEPIGSIGIASMAETGLLMDIKTGQEKINFIPWFNTCANEEANWIKENEDMQERFQKCGLHLNHKAALPKIIFLKKRTPEVLEGTTWLSMSDYIAYKLTGVAATDYTLAARTYLFDIRNKQWDYEWIEHLGLNKELFPPVFPSGNIMGTVTSQAAEATGLKAKIPVAIAGHDHLCASVGMGISKQGEVINSVGTAETLMGTLDEYQGDEKQYQSGLSFGCHVFKDKYFWMGNLPSSGGSVEWARESLSASKLSYEKLRHILKDGSNNPTDIYFFPYLSGSGSPVPNSDARASFIGLRSSHTHEDLVKAVFEGVSYQFSIICESVKSELGIPLDSISVVGGGAKNREWLELKANISNLKLWIPSESEAVLLGAAILSGIGSGIYQNFEEVDTQMKTRLKAVIEPNNEIHQKYRKKLESFWSIQSALQKFFKIT